MASRCACAEATASIIAIDGEPTEWVCSTCALPTTAPESRLVRDATRRILPLESFEALYEGLGPSTDQVAGAFLEHLRTRLRRDPSRGRPDVRGPATVRLESWLLADADERLVLLVGEDANGRVTRSLMLHPDLCAWA